MLFFPWRDEETDFKGNCDSYKDRYMMHKDNINKIYVHYEKFNEDLEEALENAASKEYEENISVNDEDMEKNTDVITTRCTIIGDFNRKSVLPNANDYNEKLTEHMLKKYNMKQYVNTSTTENESILDLCFSNCSNIEHVFTWNHWSAHKIVSVILQNEIITYN